MECLTAQTVCYAAYIVCLCCDALTPVTQASTRAALDQQMAMKARINLSTMQALRRTVLISSRLCCAMC